MIRNQVLTCDHPGCARRLLITGAGRTRTKERRRAMQQGWTRDASGGDLCPDHATARPAEQGEGRPMTGGPAQ